MLFSISHDSYKNLYLVFYDHILIALASGPFFPIMTRNTYLVQYLQKKMSTYTLSENNVLQDDLFNLLRTSSHINMVVY